ncbi:hypothetical protein OIU85_007034 [Salix viminalis]|uniref:Protein kinase domain-containing protein n=1 Tax=Salix viminalis TaxID=40686 RepID=A0A9Q0P7Y5_SALVM|nr:hypothetical protein OIU85_007034 [Salix viminalis]
MPLSRWQAACSSSRLFLDYADNLADQIAMLLVQTLRPVVEAAARSAAGYCSRLPIGINLSSTTRPRITDWERGDHIGKGSFASVYKWYSKEHKLFFAAKGVSLNEHRHICHLENEIAVLKRLHHENIIQYYGTEKGEEMLYIFLELPVLGAWPDRNAVSLDRAIRSGKGPVVPDYLSDTLKDFITQCLQPDPNQRPTAADLLAHRFVNESSCPQPDLTELLLLF